MRKILAVLFLAALILIGFKRQEPFALNQDQNKDYPEFTWLEGRQPYAKFSFVWKQQNPPSAAEIKASCLGHYQLLVNGEPLYNGPTFATPPKIYFDRIDLKEAVRLGENRLDFICNFISEDIHEYPKYEVPAALVGGEIKDGNKMHFLSDETAWFVAKPNIKNGLRLSNTAGFSEIVDLTLRERFSPSGRAKIDLILSPRPIPLISYEPQVLQKISDSVWDLGSFKVGYLTVSADLEKQCTVQISWEDPPYFNQQDKVTFPAGKTVWHQFSRRAARFVQLDSSNCSGKVDLGFRRVGMPFNLPAAPGKQEDKKIFEISANTLRNNIQDHFEDSVVRERALYVGDALAMSKCLVSTPTNNSLIKEMVLRFADTQREDGSLPPRTTGGQLIPSYSLQWISLAALYLERTNDTPFAKNIWPSVKKVLDWAKENESPEGFLYDKNASWWSFIDWTPTDTPYKFTTALELWYIAALEDAAAIVHIAGQDAKAYTEKAARLREAIREFAYDEQNRVFADSFEAGKKSQGSLVTNALAGKFGVFKTPGQSTEALHKFAGNLATNTPYSQTWVVEWLVTVGDRDQALRTMRMFWGKLVEEGWTTVPEIVADTSEIEINQSNSHGWGCGPVFLYGIIKK